MSTNNQRQVASVSVDAVVNSTAYICNVTYENHLVPCRVLVHKTEEESIPTSVAQLKDAVHLTGAASEISLDGCEYHMSNTAGYMVNEVIL